MNAKPERLQKRRRGFSLVEMLVVITVIGIVAAIAIPSISSIRQQARVNATVADFKTFRTAIIAYALLENGYPADTHETLPGGAAMQPYLSAAAFEREAPITGRYNWEGPERYPYAGVSLTSTRATLSELKSVDDLLDDGNLSTGYFRFTRNGRYTYIIEDDI